MGITRLAGAALVFFLTALPAAAELPERVDLTPIEHLEASLEVISPDGTSHRFTPEELETFETYRLVTRTPWRDEPAQFEGVLLTDLLESTGLSSASEIMVTAENDYRTSIPGHAWAEMPILLATRVNGAPLSRRERGPILFVVPFESYTASSSFQESYLVWMAARIEAAR